MDPLVHIGILVLRFSLAKAVRRGSAINSDPKCVSSTGSDKASPVNTGVFLDPNGSGGSVEAREGAIHSCGWPWLADHVVRAREAFNQFSSTHSLDSSTALSYVTGSRICKLVDSPLCPKARPPQCGIYAGETFQTSALLPAALP